MDRPAPSLLPTPSWASATQDPPRREPGEPGTPAISGREEQTKPWCSTKGKLAKCRISFWWNLSSNLFRGTLTIPWAPYCDRALRTTLLRELSASGTLCRTSLLPGLSAPGPLCSSTVPPLSGTPTCPSPSPVPLTKWTQPLPPLLAVEKSGATCCAPSCESFWKQFLRAETRTYDGESRFTKMSSLR